MKPKYTEQTIKEIIGVLDVNEDGKKFINVELKDEAIVIEVETLLNGMVGTMIQIKSVSDED